MSRVSGNHERSAGDRLPWRTGPAARRARRRAGWADLLFDL